jgi:hypothetical protein
MDRRRSRLSPSLHTLGYRPTYAHFLFGRFEYILAVSAAAAKTLTSEWAVIPFWEDPILHLPFTMEGHKK